MKAPTKVKSSPVPRRLAVEADIPSDWLTPSESPNPFVPAPTKLHRYGENNSKICCTENRGYPTPEDRSPAELVVDASEGFIPLWAVGRTLHYRFNEQSMQYFQSPSKAKSAILTLFAEAISAWGDSAPVRFAENTDTYDFEVFMNRHARENLSSFGNLSNADIADLPWATPGYVFTLPFNNATRRWDDTGARPNK